MLTDDLTPIERLTRDIRAAAATLGPAEARFLVDAYYSMQNDRIRGGNQVRALTTKTEDHPKVEPHTIVAWFAKQSEGLETQIKGALGKYAAAHEVGDWLLGVTGIGPVIAAGLVAHIDIEQAPTVGHIWRYAGLDPTSIWEKGKKRPFNASLKVVCWKAGESFVKHSGNPKDVYGKVYKARKEQEEQRNAAGAFADQAAAKLEKYKIGKTTEAYGHYSAGRLPPAHIHARAKRYAVKLFLSHLHGEWYRRHFGKEAPLPYPIAILGHAHVI